jgi:hypothetical protein
LDLELQKKVVLCLFGLLFILSIVPMLTINTEDYWPLPIYAGLQFILLLTALSMREVWLRYSCALLLAISILLLFTTIGIIHVMFGIAAKDVEPAQAKLDVGTVQLIMWLSALFIAAVYGWTARVLVLDAREQA